MDNRYKIIVSNKNLYKEIELPPEMAFAKIGTGIDCTFRLLKDLFFDSIELSFQKKAGIWSVVCADNLYITTGDVRKLVTKELTHGDIFDICYRESNNPVVTIEFLLDFGGNRKYERLLHIEALSQITIGAASSNNIVLKSAFIADDQIVCVRKSDGFEIKVIKSKYGVYVNDKKISNAEHLGYGDFISVSDYTFYLSEQGLWTEIREDLSINGLQYEDYPNPNDYPKFIRNARLHGKINEEAIEILDPASKPEKPKNNLFMSLLPSMGMMLTSGAMAMQGGGTMIVFSVVSASMAVVTAVLGFVDNRKDYKKTLLKRTEEYNAYIARKRQEISQLRDFEKKQLEDLYIDVEEEKQHLINFSSDLFDRQADDEDFLFVRLGTGSVAAKRVVQYKKKEKLETDDDLQLIPVTVRDESIFIEDAPVVFDLRSANAVCIFGDPDHRFAIFRNIIMDICTRQYKTDVELIFIAEESHKDKISWLRFLPHVNNEETGFRNIVIDDESKNRVFDYLFKELTERENKKNEKKQFRHIVAFFYDEYGFQRHPISKFVSKGKELGVTFVFMVDHRSQVPVGCTCMIAMQSDKEGRLVNISDKDMQVPFVCEPISEEDSQHMVQLLAPVYTEEISLEGGLTKNISLFEMMNIFMPEDLDLETRWGASQVYKTMAAPIGVTKNGIVCLDLHDKAHGPHGLVAGTTGSGKSEILQTYILSVATLFHPYEISFVIIDFKGGGMVNQFKDLPHLLGAITNIDGKQIDRSLKSIKAELQKRQRLFAEADVNHIDKYIKKYKAGEVNTPIPHLVLIVDEFAELKAEQPDFMKELISAARIGRSLGVHLILATQKPSGQVDEQIWSNSRFKLCLKVQSVEDSNEVLKSPLAAEIKEPGRAYLQVGNNEVFELFQSAYSGAPEKMTDSNVKEFSIFEVTETGKHKPIFVQKKKKNSANNFTQLDAIVRHVHDFCENKKIRQLDDICLPPLQNIINHPAETVDTMGRVDIGVYDDPDNQVQASMYLDLDNKHTFILGSSQYGKTNLLQSFIKSIAHAYTVDQAVVYIMDFGSMILKNFENLAHVGGVVTSSEDEKQKNLFKLLFEEISRRKDILLAVGVSSFAAYREAGYTDLPHIYLIIDNLTALNELYLQDDDSLISILREGISVGLSVIVANAQTTGIGFRYLSNFANKVAFFCNDSSEYNNLFDHIALKPDETPGRCVLEADKRMLECQTYLAFPGEKEIDRVNRMADFVAEVNNNNIGKKAKQIPFIPPLLTAEILNRDYDAVPTGSRIPIGLRYEDVKPCYIDLSTVGIMGICGKEGFGHRNLTEYILRTVRESKVEAEIVLFDDISKKLAPFKRLADKYFLNTESAPEIIKRWHSELEARYNRLLVESAGENHDKLLIMIIQNNDVASALTSDYDAQNMLEDFADRFRGLGAAILFVNYPNSSVSYDAPLALRLIKQNRKMIALEDLDKLKPVDLPYEALRDNKKPISVGDGYMLDDSDVTKVKFVLAKEEK